MAFGKLFAGPNNPRSTAIRAVAKANDIDLEVIEVERFTTTPELLKANPLGKVPTFVGSDGFVLSECIAIAIFITSQNEKTTLLGANKQDYASMLKWMSFFNSEVLPSLAAWYLPLLGVTPYNKKAIDEGEKAAHKALAVAEKHLTNNTYLVSERITLADLFSAGIIARGFEFFFDKAWRAKNPAITRWYETVYRQPLFSAVAPEFSLLDTPKLQNVPPKKEAKKESGQPRVAPPAAAADAAATTGQPGGGEEEASSTPKPKHPLDVLPKSSFHLDEWKRYYSNNDTPKALKWFWENVPLSDYSIWKVRYKYNDELTLTFMSNNLIGGFNARLEASRKHIFGVACVFGENNDSAIEGVFVIRGDEYKPAFDVAPDYESYDFEKLDPANPAHKAILESHWSDTPNPITVNGKEYAYANGTGKVFK